MTTETGSLWIEAAIDCVLSVMEWLVSNVATWILIHIYKFRTTNKTVLPLHIFISQNTWKPFAEPSFRNTGVDVMIMDEGYVIACKYENIMSLYVLLLYFYRDFGRE